MYIGSIIRINLFSLLSVRLSQNTFEERLNRAPMCYLKH
jgi:hypothetical protein